jgi:hypothetical protein
MTALPTDLRRDSNTLGGGAVKTRGAEGRDEVYTVGESRVGSVDDACVDPRDSEGADRLLKDDDGRIISELRDVRLQSTVMFTATRLPVALSSYPTHTHTHTPVEERLSRTAAPFEQRGDSAPCR